MRRDHVGRRAGSDNDGSRVRLGRDDGGGAMLSRGVGRGVRDSQSRLRSDGRGQSRV